jgi:hypothetical protein
MTGASGFSGACDLLNKSSNFAEICDECRPETPTLQSPRHMCIPFA